MNEHLILTLALILVVGMACQWLAWRVKLPAIVFLLATGILAGPLLGWLNPDALLGELLFPFVSLAVAVILFEGSLTLKLRDIPGLAKVIRNLITFGALISWLIAALSARLLLNFTWEISALFGAIMVVTGPTVIMPMIRTLRPKENVANVLQWEGILIDPIGALLAVLVYEFIVSGGVQGGLLIGVTLFAKILLVGTLFGFGGGYLFSILLCRYWVPQYLHNVIALALVCGVFALSNLLAVESGLLAVTLMGVFLANRPGLDLEDILDFKETLSLLLISLLFILLAARMDLYRFLELGWGALGVFATIQFLSRPLSVQLCALGSKLSMAERHLLSWIAPRGIVAAAISALFALKLETLGYQNADQLVPLTFMVIIGTVLLQSATAGPIATKLGVREPESRGFLIVGANPLAQAIAIALKENNFRILLIDQNWTAVRECKMKNLPAYWGNPVSQHAERHLNLVGIGHLLAISPQFEINALAAQYFRFEFEPRNIYRIHQQQQKGAKAQSQVDFKYGGRLLFGKDMTYQRLSECLTQGWKIKKTPLTANFTFKDYLADPKRRRLPLFALDDDEGIHFFCEDADFTPSAGWKILAFTLEKAQDAKEN